MARKAREAGGLREQEVLAWLRGAPEPPHTVYLVHGEPGGAQRLRDRIRHELGWNAVVPRSGERVLVR
ncbi:MBL fold metallo-hydrolase RNA specificity domain-containing protein [Streptacidiphilus neutrinimicus]|uniref:MBL fold metallo-hydrolase RNA specificity domain-containing protein n=1 Tax=Streptacidiphilus neutrinimicus TaxID=105420 RepID=UPI0005A687D5|nr:MBL fold metallo-hydrolase RNA specificity domain-containing protein [Streptacidiphilus neutrinimicus]